MSICEATTLDRIFRPSTTTAAAVSSHDDSIPSIFTPSFAPFVTKSRPFSLSVGLRLRSIPYPRPFNFHATTRPPRRSLPTALCHSDTSTCCHPDRSGPIFFSAPPFGASGRGVERTAARTQQSSTIPWATVNAPVRLLRRTADSTTRRVNLSSPKQSAAGAAPPPYAHPPPCTCAPCAHPFRVSLTRLPPRVYCELVFQIHFRARISFSL